ncbi:MAG: hypothetical protein IKT37_06125 [Clostridia bacterium]|nr:hypothetical protein [Clostridia bacterium]
MNDCVTLKSEQFYLSLGFQVFESDVCFPSNTILTVSVSSNSFSATVTMDIDIKSVSVFCSELKMLYDTLNGAAGLYEAFGDQYIKFCGDGKGHINVCGLLKSNGIDGFYQELKFENQIDQTFLPAFLSSLNILADRYVK